MKRYVEFTGGSSAKFWEVGTKGRNLIVRFGRLGTAGQTQTKEFATPQQAEAQAEQQLAAKLRKGYVQSQPH